MTFKKLSILAFILVLFSIQTVDAQSHQDYYKKGVRAYNRHAYEEALEMFRLSLQTKPVSAHTWYLKAMSHKKLEQYHEADRAFQKLVKVKPDYNAWAYLEAGELYIMMNKFSAAETMIKVFLKTYPDIPKNELNRHRGLNRLYYAQESQAIRAKESTTSMPVPVDRLNSISDDLTPNISPTGNRFYITSMREGGLGAFEPNSRKNNYGEDIYYSYKTYEGWSTPKLMPEPINSTDDDFGASFTGDGQTMVYVRCGTEEGLGGCDLYITQLQGNQWDEPVNMGNAVNSKKWDSQPAISSDGSTIIFASARDGGYGGIDLYMTQKNHMGDWGIAQNLGSLINTPFTDVSPSLAPDGKTLYYATDGHPGFGKLDVFYSLFDNGRWTVPLNVGAPINSAEDDKNFTTSVTGTAFFASARLDEDNIDIFEVELPDFLKPKPSLMVLGKVSNASTSDPIDALVMVEDMDTGELLAVNKSNSNTGEYLVVLPVGRNYSVSASKDGYFFYSTNFDLPKDTAFFELKKDINLEPITKGTKVVLNNIFFESGRAELKPVSYVELSKAVDLMKKNPTIVIEIGGHTDNIGSEAYNQKLSEARAKSVVDYLIDKIFINLLWN